VCVILGLSRRGRTEKIIGGNFKTTNPALVVHGSSTNAVGPIGGAFAIGGGVTRGSDDCRNATLRSGGGN